MAARVVLTIEITGEPRRGWCSHCQLPSMLEFDLVALSDDDVRPFGVYRVCADCGGHP